VFETQLAYHTNAWPSEYLVGAMHEITQIGYDGIEVAWSLAESYADRVDVFMEMLHDEHLELAAIDSPLWLLAPDSKEDEKERFLAIGRFAAAVGAHVVVAMAPRKWPDIPVSDEEWQAITDFSNEVGVEIEGMGLKFVFHPEVGTWLDTRREIERFLNETAPEAVGLCIDTAQFTYNRINPANYYLSIHDRVHHIHMKDYVKNKQPYEKRLRPLGRGEVDLKALVRNLDKKDYNGWVVSELDMPYEQNANPSANASTAYEYCIHTLDLGL